ncbi:MAG: zinc resistance protein [Syntrophorhabdus sp. PtaU1.Bin058]|nr:MAG: zinc resistance protein [Syntrophorhabdus sp. PtaU1.Bin058]
MKKIHVGMLVVLFVALAATVFAFGPGSGPAGYGGAGGPGLTRSGYGYGPGLNLNLSKEQADKLWQLKEKHRNETSAMRYELFQKQNELRTLYANPGADDATILARQKEVNALRTKLQDKAVQFKLDERKILTPEQLKQINEYGRGRGFSRRGYGPGACGRL